MKNVQVVVTEIWYSISVAPAIKVDLAFNTLMWYKNIIPNFHINNGFHEPRLSTVRVNLRWSFQNIFTLRQHWFSLSALLFIQWDTNIYMMLKTLNQSSMLTLIYSQKIKKVIVSFQEVDIMSMKMVNPKPSFRFWAGGRGKQTTLTSLRIMLKFPRVVSSEKCGKSQGGFTIMP